MESKLSISQNVVDRCRKGDGSAYNEVYQMCSKGVFNSILRIVRQREEAEDLLQETFMSAFQNIKSYRGEASLFGWIKRIGVNKALNAIKKRKIQFEYEETDAIEEESEEAEWEQLKLNARDILENLSELPEGFRVVLTLYLFEGYTHKAIAEELGISENTSKTQYLRGKKKLKEHLLHSYEGTR
ncbi:RNA polymerase sigma factor [Parvicella tangerina]|uniref:ECF RNA polymerase sigma factor SigE n=1 Tax=Parvicella tangerina TaxID=2829795 RepID=A0A916JJ60_9FLAO|nr:sigma-70 family RNA polymerase sigma factor [Parvicella tangerina]CAG5076893.1 ECF RNA polymerase sigma factor SigE [Parvicella tangerina]